MPRLTTPLFRILMATTAVALANGSSAQTSEMMRFGTRVHHVNSGVHHGNDDPLVDESERAVLTPAFATLVHSPGVNLIRVHFAGFDLDQYSEVHLISTKDGALQRFNQAMLIEWDGWSAIFNGDSVMVYLMVAANEEVSFEIDEVSVNDPPQVVVEGGGIASLCGADNRTSAADSRVGRLSGANCNAANPNNCGGCTAWLTSIGSVMTAGHCGTASGGLIEFNVPISNTNGMPVAANPNDQYPVGVTWYTFQDAGAGFDWANVSVGRNSNTNLRAHWVQGYFHLSPLMPADGTTLRITGCGVDNTPTGSQPNNCCAQDANGNCTHMGCNSSSVTLQTSTGAKTDDTANRVLYAVDTEPANSGSPVIWNSNSFAIGVHTHGGCTAGGGQNGGTRLTQPVLAQSLHHFLNFATFVDATNVGSLPLGTAMDPAWSVPQAIGLTPSGGTVALAGGSYTAAAGNTGTFSTPMTLRAVSGNVFIGN